MRLLGPLALAATTLLGLVACSAEDEGGESTTTVAASPTATVQTFLAEFDIDVDETDAGCVARSLAVSTVDVPAEANNGGDEVGEEPYLDLYEALVRCEPEAYVAAQAASITSVSDASDEDARCVIHAANALIASDPAVLAVAAKEGSTKDWPEAEKAKLREAVLTCVPADLADDIVDD